MTFPKTRRIQGDVVKLFKCFIIPFRTSLSSKLFNSFNYVPLCFPNLCDIFDFKVDCPQARPDPDSPSSHNVPLFYMPWDFHLRASLIVSLSFFFAYHNGLGNFIMPALVLFVKKNPYKAQKKWQSGQDKSDISYNALAE